MSGNASCANCRYWLPVADHYLNVQADGFGLCLEIDKDGSGYLASLRTRPEFSCALFAEKEVEP